MNMLSNNEMTSTQQQSPLWKKTLLGVILSSISVSSFAATAVEGDDWLHVDGNQIVDMDGNPVWLTGANWFGFNATERIFHGLWSVNLEDTLDSIAARGINILRVPISTELMMEWQNGIYSTAQANTATNPDLIGATSLDVFDAMMAHSKKIGLKILLDAHSAEADNSGHIEPMWYTDNVTSDDFYSAWEWITQRYADDDTLIAFDLENEPHGKPWADENFAKWDDSTDENNWKYACETAANRILNINPNMLVMCEGIETFPTDGVTWTSTNSDDYHSNWWGGNLRGVRDLPVDLGEHQDQFMYSPHDYGPLVYEQDWFYDGFSKETLYEDVWKDNWMFIHEENISPLLIGEWGGFMDGGDNETWMIAIRDLIIEHGLHHTFWCINPNSGDTGGLLQDDWTTWDEEKYALFEPSLWRDSTSGKFISLDHEVALGSDDTGISLGDYVSGLSPSVTISSPDEGDTLLTDTLFSITYSLTQAEGVNVYLDGELVEENVTTNSVSVTSPSTSGDFTVKLVGVDEDGAELDITDSITLSALFEIPLDPQIAITTPTDGYSVEVNSTFDIAVSLEDATGFSATLNNITSTFTSDTGTITAPSEAGEYTLFVTALDEDETELAATDSIDITVTETPVSTSGDLACTVDGAHSWNTGFVLSEVKVTNNGNESTDDWSVTLNFEDEMEYVNGWNGSFTAGSQSVTVTALSYNSTLSAGQSTSFGMQGSYSSTFTAPTCTVN